MRDNGNLTQWSNGYPSKDIIINDINENAAFVCMENEEIAGYFCFMKGENPDANYEVIEDGDWLNGQSLRRHPSFGIGPKSERNCPNRF